MTKASQFMGIDCYGWVEVRDAETHYRDELMSPNSWSGVIRIDDLVVGLAAQQAGCPDLISSPTRVLAHTWEGLLA